MNLNAVIQRVVSVEPILSERIDQTGHPAEIIALARGDEVQASAVTDDVAKKVSGGIVNALVREGGARAIEHGGAGALTVGIVFIELALGG